MTSFAVSEIKLKTKLRYVAHIPTRRLYIAVKLRAAPVLKTRIRQLLRLQNACH